MLHRNIVLLCLVAASPASLAAQQRDTTRTDSIPRLPAVEVTVARRPGTIGTLPFAIAEMDSVELRRGRATVGLDEAFVTLPGVFIANRYNPAQDQRLSIRGFGARSAFGIRGVKILLDGIPQTLPDGQGQLTNVELGEIARVEVLRGSSSALYGNAAGGVVSLQTVSPTGAFEGMARATGGSFKMRKFQFSGGAPIGTGGLRLTVSHTQAAGYREHSFRERTNAALRLLEPLGVRTTLRVHAQITDDRLAENPGSLTRQQVEEDPAQADPRNVAANARKLVKQFQTAAGVEHGFAASNVLNASAFFIRRSLDNPLSFGTITLERWAWGVRAGSVFDLSRTPGSPVLTVGLDAQWQRDDRLNTTTDGSTITRDQLENVVEIGPYAQATFDLSTQVSLTLGGRYDRVSYTVDDRLLSDGDQSGSTTMDAPSFTVGLNALVAPAFVPYAQVGTSFQTPTTTEIVNQPTGGGGINPEISAQTAINYELGVRGELGDFFDYALSGFIANVNGELIPFEVPSEPSRTFFRNAGESRHQGIELGGGFDLPAGFSVLGAYTYADYTFTEFRTESDTLDGNTIPGVPKHRVHLSLRFTSAPGLWAAIDYNYSSSVITNDQNTAYADAWMTTGIRAGWEGKVGRVELRPFVSVLNVFDESYVGSVVVNAFRDRFYEPAPGRNAIIGLEIGAF